MSKTETKRENLAELQARAQTSADHDAVVLAVKRHIDESKARLAALEGQRAQVVFSGDDLTRFLRTLGEERERLATYEATLAVARQNRDEAHRREERERVERLAGHARTSDLPKLESAWHRFHKAMIEVVASAEEIEAAELRVEGADQLAKRHDRPDLVIGARRVRSVVAQQIAPNRGVPRPQIVRARNESEDAFTLRRASAESRAMQEELRRDPILMAAMKAVDFIERHGMNMDAHMRDRSRALTRRRTFIHPEHGAALRTERLDADGRASPVGPYRTPGDFKPKPSSSSDATNYERFRQTYEPPSTKLG